MKTKEQKELLAKCRHRAEIPMTVIAVILTVLFVFLVVFLVRSLGDDQRAEDFLVNQLEFEETDIEFALKCGKYLVVAIIAVMVLKLAWELFRNAGIAMVEDIPIEESDSPEIFQEYREYCEKLGITDIPKFLLAADRGNLESTGITIKSNRYLRMNIFGIGLDDSITKFDILHDLADMAYRHYDYPLLIATVVARRLPLVKNLYSRIMCYSSDRLAAELMGREECITVLLRKYLKAAYEEDQREEYVKRLDRELNFVEKISAVLNNLSTDTPSYIYRLKAIVDDKSGRVI